MLSYNSTNLLDSKVVLKKFALQNLSFLPTSGVSFFKKIILFNANMQVNNVLFPYLNLMLFFTHTLNFILLNFIKLHFLTPNYFTLRNLKFFTSKVTETSLGLYLCGSNKSSFFSAKGFGLFNKFFRSFSNYSDLFFLSWVSNIFFIGVGYKVFIFNRYLYLRLGFSKMLKIIIPDGVAVLTRKRNHLRIISTSHEHLESFLYLLKNLRVFDCYKGKGVFQTSDFSTVKLKVGKKQQFF